MDIVRSKTENKFYQSKKTITTAIVLIVLASLYFFSNKSGGFLVNKDTVLIDKVQRGDLNVSVRGIGILVPKDIRWVATNVQGRVERILIKAGAEVKAGDLLMELSNPNLQQLLEETQWDLEELEAQTNAQSVSLDSQLLDQEAAVTNERLNHERALLTLNAQKKLLSQGIVAVSEIDHEEVKIDVAQHKERWNLETKRLAKRQENAVAQRVAYQARLNRVRRTLQRIQDQVDGLKVRATMDSIVQEMPMELGQQVNSGTNLARLARKGEFIAELRIPEKQINTVQIGQAVMVDTRTSKVAGKVIRIDPTVINGSVQIDVALVDNAPREARPDLTVDGIIEIDHIKDAIFVKRPMYAKNFSEGEVYILDSDGKYANKKKVKFGKVSTKYIQVERGLVAGESIIVSDASTWQTYQQIRLN